MERTQDIEGSGMYRIQGYRMYKKDLCLQEDGDLGWNAAQALI
jgi:hypothetical protein